MYVKTGTQIFIIAVHEMFKFLSPIGINMTKQVFTQSKFYLGDIAIAQIKYLNVSMDFIYGVIKWSIWILDLPFKVR